MRRRPTPRDLERTAAARERTRAQLLARIPRWYNPWAHLATTTGIGLVVLAVGLHELRAVRPIELLVVPAVLAFANAFEWRVHRSVLHRRLWPVGIIYQRHTPEHHAVYMTNDMEIRSWRELRLVLVPALGILGIVLATAPIAWVVRLLLGANVGWLFLVTAALYLVSYEVLHLAYHLPAASVIGRNRLVRALRAHHARHHDPRLMQKWNFNVTLPLFDWIHGTIAPEGLASPVDDPSAAPRGPAELPGGGAHRA